MQWFGKVTRNHDQLFDLATTMIQGRVLKRGRGDLERTGWVT